MLLATSDCRGVSLRRSAPVIRSGIRRSDLRGLEIGGRVWKGSDEFSSLMVVLTSASPAIAVRGQKHSAIRDDAPCAI